MDMEIQLVHDRDYQMLAKKKEVLEFIRDLRMCTITLSNANQSLINRQSFALYLKDYLKLYFRIATIIDNVESRLVDLNAVGTLGVEELARSIIDRYPEAYKTVEKMTKEIMAIAAICPDIKPLTIELMEFYKGYKSICGEDHNVKGAINGLLSRLNYYTSEREKEYLSNKCLDADWYVTFYFANPTSVPENYSANLDELLKSTLEPSNSPRSDFLSKVMEQYGSCRKELTLNSQTLYDLTFKRAFALGTFRNVRIEQFILERLKINKIDASVHLEKIARQMTEASINIHGTLPRNIERAKSIYIALAELAGDKDASLVMAKVLSDEDERIADGLETYIRSLRGERYADIYVEKYLSFHSERERKRIDVIKTLKLIAQKKKES